MLLIFGAITLLMHEGAVQVRDGHISGGTIAAFVLTGGLVAGAFGAFAVEPDFTLGADEEIVGRRLDAVGGVVLIALGTKILIEHLSS